jgi:predicted DNA-binding transcriptional regulator AlpA
VAKENCRGRRRTLGAASVKPEIQSPAYVTTAQASHLTGLSPAWFERSRWAGGGPPFVKLGAAVRYPADKLHAWMRARIRRSTTVEG